MRILLLGLAVLIALALTTQAEAEIIVPNDYPTIQQAINAASPGETILVRDGIYKENVKVNKSVKIISENGSANCIVKAVRSYDNVFEITADNVTVSGFTITDAGYANAGIYIEANNSVITNNNIENNSRGIHLDDSNNNIIASNKFTNDGLFSFYSYNNKVTNNTVNGKPLVYLENVKDYVVTNAGQVIAVECNNITVKNLNLSNITVGVEFWCTSNSRIENVVVENNSRGIYLRFSNNNSITNNNIENNYYGIYLLKSKNNIIASNKFTNNRFFLLYSYNNKIYLNNFNNTNNIDTYDSINYFNSSKPITYQYNGKTFTNYLGNYWSDYIGKDANNDGIGDMPYVIDENNKDYYPLMQPRK